MALILPYKDKIYDCPYKGEFRSAKIHILPYLMQCLERG